MAREDDEYNLGEELRRFVLFWVFETLFIFLSLPSNPFWERHDD
jgi:hypothetical protein